MLDWMWDISGATRLMVYQVLTDLLMTLKSRGEIAWMKNRRGWEEGVLYRAAILDGRYRRFELKMLDDTLVIRSSGGRGANGGLPFLLSGEVITTNAEISKRDRVELTVLEWQKHFGKFGQLPAEALESCKRDVGNVIRGALCLANIPWEHFSLTLDTRGHHRLAVFDPPRPWLILLPYGSGNQPFKIAAQIKLFLDNAAKQTVVSHVVYQPNPAELPYLQIASLEFSVYNNYDAMTNLRSAEKARELAQHPIERSEPL